MSTPYPPPNYGPPNYPAFPPGMPGPAPKPRRRWPWVVGGVLLVLFLIGVTTGNNRQASTTTTGGSYTAPAQASKSLPPAAPVAVAPAQASTGPATSFGDGTWVVGEDIVPGTYKSSGAQEGLFEFCVITTYAGDTPDSKVLNLDTANANEPMRVKVSGSVKSVSVHGCTDFQKV